MGGRGRWFLHPWCFGRKSPPKTLPIFFNPKGFRKAPSLPRPGFRSGSRSEFRSGFGWKNASDIFASLGIPGAIAWHVGLKIYRSIVSNVGNHAKIFGPKIQNLRFAFERHVPYRSTNPLFITQTSWRGIFTQRWTTGLQYLMSQIHSRPPLARIESHGSEPGLGPERNGPSNRSVSPRRTWPSKPDVRRTALLDYSRPRLQAVEHLLGS